MLRKKICIFLERIKVFSYVLLETNARQINNKKKHCTEGIF